MSDLAIPELSLVCLVGASGSDKSTLPPSTSAASRSCPATSVAT